MVPSLKKDDWRVIDSYAYTSNTNILTYLQLKERKINRNQPKKAKKLFKTSLGLNLFFLISNIPVSTVFIIGNISNINFSNVIYNIFKLITYAYFSLDFFIYYIANRLFRVYFFLYHGRLAHATYF